MITLIIRTPGLLTLDIFLTLSTFLMIVQVLYGVSNVLKKFLTVQKKIS